MSKSEGMIPVKRRQKILNLLKRHDSVISIVELTRALKVSHMTVRRDLHKLEEDGLLIQVSGGAQMVTRINSEPSHLQKESQASNEKEAIGSYAATIIPENACIYLDAGTTSLALCRHIFKRDDLTIVSNDFEVINFLIPRTESQLIHTGGLVEKANRSCVGQFAAQLLSSMSFDIGFISASSWEIRGITTPDMRKIQVKKAVVDSSRHSVLICDSTKYAQSSKFLAVPMENIDTIITDTNLPEHAQRTLSKLELELVMV